MTIWMKVTLDKYEFPVEIADSPLALAIKCGTTKGCIISGASKYKCGVQRTSYRKVVIEEEDEWTDR